MNNREISRILRSHPTIHNDFNGVFPGDMLPTDRRPGFYVANTDPHNLPGKHWVAFYIPQNGVMEYWDSYGFEPPDIFQTFLTDTFKRSRKFIQHPLSSTCGQYCIFYILQRHKGYTLQEIVSYFSVNTLENDIIVNKAIEENFCVDLDIFDYSFICKQICQSLKQYMN